MKTIKIYPLIIVIGLMAQNGLCEEPGDRCQPGEIGRPGLTCQATGDFEYEPPYILNAKKGDVVLVSAPGTIGGLLRNVWPPQKYCHAGIIVNNSPMKLRSSTAWAPQERYKDNQVICDLTFVDIPLGISPDVLKYGWPGTVTETLTEGYEGRERTSPEGRPYRGQTYSSDPNNSYPDTPTIYPTVVKPPADKEMGDATVRTRLHQIAAHSETIKGHYRWFRYTRGDIFEDPALRCPPGGCFWSGEDHPMPTMCASFIWGSAKAAGVEVENLLPSDPSDVIDRPHALLPSQRGLYRYSEAERKRAANWLYDHIKNKVNKEEKDAHLVNADDRFASQMVNAFASDDCRLTPIGSGVPCTDPASHAWASPGEGVTVSPDDIMSWNMPPNGVYGLNQPMIYIQGGNQRVYKWAASAGTANVFVNVLYVGYPVYAATVILYAAGFPAEKTDDLGRANFLAVPGGKYVIQADLAVSGRKLRAKKLVDVPSTGEITVDLDLVEFIEIPPPPPELHRRFTFKCIVEIKDANCVGSDDLRILDVFFSGDLNPVENKDADNWEDSAGDIKAAIQVETQLYSTEIQFKVTASLYDDDDLEVSHSITFTVPKDEKWAGGGITLNDVDACVTDYVHVSFEEIHNAQRVP